MLYREHGKLDRNKECARNLNPDQFPPSRLLLSAQREICTQRRPMTSPDGLYRLTTTPFAPISFHSQITKKETENKTKRTVSATEPVVGSPFLSFLQTPVCLSPPIITYFKANENTKHKKRKGSSYQYNNISFPSSFYVSFSFLGFTKHFTKSEGKKRTKHIHTGLLLQFQQRLILVPTTETKSRKNDLTSAEETKQKKNQRIYNIP